MGSMGEQLESRCRLIAWAGPRPLQRIAGAVAGAVRRDARRVAAHARHVERYLSATSPNTTSRARRSASSTPAPCSGAASRRALADVGARILVDECERQILSDASTSSGPPLPALHARDLSPLLILPAERLAGPARDCRTGRQDARLHARGALPRRLGALDRRCRTADRSRTCPPPPG